MRARRRRHRAHRPAGHRAARSPARSRGADGRRPSRRRLAPARGAPAARARRSVPDDPPVLGRAAVPLVRLRRSDARIGRVLETMVRAGLEHRGVGRDERGQDDVRERARGGDRSDRADRHDRGDRGAAARSSACRAARGAPRERGGRRRGERARAGAGRAADATRSARRRRGARRRGVRHAPGAQHRSRRFALDRARELARSTRSPGSRRSCCSVASRSRSPAVRAQLSSAIDAIVQVARGADGSPARSSRSPRSGRRETDARSRARSLLTRVAGDLVRRDAPTRARRRAGFDARGGVVALRHPRSSR